MVSSPIPAVFGTRPAATRILLPSIVCSRAFVRPGKAHFLSRSAMDSEYFSRCRKLNVFAAKYLLDFVGDVGVFPANDARPTLNDGHSATETTIGLCHLEADIAAAEHDQVRSVDVGEPPCSLEAGDLGIAACDPVFRNTRSPVRCD